MSNWLSKSITVKIISLLFAIILWTYVMGEKNPPITDTRANIPVNILNIAEMEKNGIVLVGQRDFRVDVRIRGRRSSVLEIKPGDIIVEADILGYKKGTNNVPLLVRYPDRVELVEVIPNTIKITLDEIIKPQRQVEVIKRGSPETGYTIMEEVLQPSQVILRGPEGEVNKVDKVVVELNVDRVNKNFIETLPLKAIDSRGAEVRNVDITPETVTVDVKVSKTKLVPIRASVIGESPQGYAVTNIETTPDRIRIGSVVRDVQNIDYVPTTNIDISNLSEYTETMIDVVMPEDTKVINGAEQIIVRVYVEPIIEREMEVTNIRFNNVDDNLVVKSYSPTDKVKVKVSGVQSKINELRERDINLVANLEEKGTGVHKVPIEYRVPQGIEVREISVGEIEVNIGERVE